MLVKQAAILGIFAVAVFTCGQIAHLFGRTFDIESLVAGGAIACLSLILFEVGKK